MDVNGDLVISGDATEGGYGVINTSDPVYQVNLLSNSGFGCWSNSEGLYNTDGVLPCTTNVCVGRGLAPNNSCTTPSADTEADATTGWTNTDFDTFASDTESSEPDGSHSLHLTATGNGQWARSSDAMTLESGKLYEFNMVYKVANGDTGGSSFKIEFGSASGGAQYGAITNLYSTSWTTQSFVFEATGTTFWVMFQENGTDNDCDIYIDQVSLHEVTPGIVGANNFAMDSWGRDGTVAIYRQHNDATDTKDGSFYSLKAIPTAADDWISWSGGGVSTVPEWYQKFAGRTVTFGAWIYASKASHVFLQLRDSDTTAFDQSSDASDYHSGTPGWEWLEVTLDVSASTTRFQVFIVSDQTADTVTYYASSPMLVFGSSIGEGNYVAPVGEIVWLESRVRIGADITPASTDDKTLKIIAGLILIIVLIFVGSKLIGYVVNNMESDDMMVKLETNHGDIVIELHGDMPITTDNFKRLVKDGTYDGVIFHRIIDGFMIQGGDPTGTGMGDPSIPEILDEFRHKGGNKNNLGTISMANRGPNTGSSQFFINLDNNNFLDTKHPAFGEVVEGMDVVEKIAKVQVDGGDKPVEDVVIKRAIIL